MADEREQIRIRLPSDLIAELRKHGNLNDQIISQLRMASLNRQAMMANAMTRAIGLCFVSAETVTGKCVDKDRETLKLALEMADKMVSYFNGLVEGSPKKAAAGRMFEALSKIAFLDDSKRQSILAGFSISVT
jgi:hypothetical protein